MATDVEVCQVMWTHINEPGPEVSIMHKTESRLWFHVSLHDVSGEVTVGIPQRCALMLAHCSTVEEFKAKHAAGELKFPLLCQTRISRNLRPKDGPTTGTGEPEYLVNHNLEQVEPVNWLPGTVPIASFSDILPVLNNCPAHAQGIR